MIQIKSDAEVALMRAAGLVVGRTLAALQAANRFANSGAESAKGTI